MKQTTQASEMKKKISDLITGRTRVEHIFYYEGTYKMIEGDQLKEITGPAAAELMRTGTRLYYVSHDRRKWDNDQNKFTGEPAQHPQLADVPAGSDVINVSTAFPVEDYVKTFIYEQ